MARNGARWHGGGFTLIEVLMVVAMVALVSALVGLALPRSNNAVVRDGERLAALLEAARANSRVTGVPVSWRPTRNGFVFEGLPPTAPDLPEQWLSADTTSPGQPPVWLGPDPIIAPQTIVLRDAGSKRTVRVITDGLRPFQVEVSP